MVLEILRVANRLDRSLEQRLGRPYRVVLSIGLVASIIHQAQELMESSPTKQGLARMLIGILFGFLLLINQLGELSNRLERRQRDSAIPGDEPESEESGRERSKRRNREPRDPPNRRHSS